MTFHPPIRQLSEDSGCILCPACECDEFAVVVVDAPLTPRVAALVCAQCDLEILLEDGKFYEPKMGRA